jgi:hypothetical protein
MREALACMHACAIFNFVNLAYYCIFSCVCMGYIAKRLMMFIKQVMIDPDAPSPSEPTMREWVHWSVT